MRLGLSYQQLQSLSIMNSEELPSNSAQSERDKVLIETDDATSKFDVRTMFADAPDWWRSKEPLPPLKIDTRSKQDRLFDAIFGAIGAAAGAFQAIVGRLWR